MDSASFDADPRNFFKALGPGMLQPSAFPTISEARKDATQRAAEVLSDWGTMKSILERFEDVLIARWMKKKKNGRMKVLYAAWYV